MARKRQKITTWEYPYTARDALKNMKKYGIDSALSHDWKRTKENIGSHLEEALFDIVSGIAICIAIPVGIYQLCKISRAYNKGEKQRKRMAADEGFSEEIHPDKKIKRY